MEKIFSKLFFNLIIGCFALSGLYSCKKDESSPKQNTPITTCRLIGTSHWEPLLGPMGMFDSTYYFYDNSGRLTEFGQESGRYEKYKIIYDQAGRIDKIRDKNGDDYERRFYNASGQLFKITHTRGWMIDSIDRKTFQYDASGKIVSSWLKVFAVASNNIPDRFYFTKYFYNGKGLLTLDSTFYVANGQYVFSKRNVIEYADNPGVGVVDFQGWYDETLYLFAPLTHNIVSRIHEQTVIGGVVVENLTMKYVNNALGYPTKVDFYHNGGLWNTKKIWYECF